jgi:nicotinamide-nucleotide adenylyltransferase
MMMHILASELRDTLLRDQAPRSSSNEKEREKNDEVPGIDIGLTTLPYFTSKSTAIVESGAYPSNPTHIHLVGFDTLIRLLDPKYYPPTLTLSPLAPFFSHHRVRVTSRPGASWGEDSAQESYIQGIGEGSLDDVGGERGWMDRIERVDGREGAGVSSSRVREVLGQGGEAGELVTEGVREWIVKQALYRDGK